MFVHDVLWLCADCLRIFHPFSQRNDLLALVKADAWRPVREQKCVPVCAPGDLGRSRAIRLYCTGHATPPSCLVCPPEHFRNHLKLTMAIKLGTCNAVAIIKYQYMLWEVLAWTSLEVFRALTPDENLSTACLPNWSMTPFSCIMISDLLPNCSFSWDPCRCHEFLPYYPSSTDTIEGSHLRRKKKQSMRKCKLKHMLEKHML